MSKDGYKELLDALELHQNLLHAEQQAISSKDLNIVEDILRQKDETLQILIDAKKNTGDHFPQEIESRISNVLDQQRRNTQNFRKLHIQQDRTEPSAQESNPIFKRMRRAYFN
jgi:hypothetical protein